MSQADIAQIIWHRFANSTVETWEDETHKAEYLDCAKQIEEGMANGRADSWTLTCRNKFWERVYFAWSLLFNWPARR